ncbi:hypothetical protein NDU88_006153 [Pleurodeles waltl]|uniref:Uncharacterized protein n=1 Tax=Pleurodeles waltl TaxID=8319 RepID=A0AAV7VL39_PLEWA|nr:hypothetical protein NDU88_006153 [Pleurodeles waltl]
MYLGCVKYNQHERVCVKKGLQCVDLTHEGDLTSFLLSSGRVHHFFSPQKSDASIQSALLGPGRLCIVFTFPAVMALEIQPHDDPKTTQRGLRSPSLPQRCCTSFLQLSVSILRLRYRRASIFSREAGSTSISQPQIGVTSIFSLHGVLCVDFFLLVCQLLLSLSQELDGHHRAE